MLRYKLQHVKQVLQNNKFDDYLVYFGEIKKREKSDLMQIVLN